MKNTIGNNLTLTLFGESHGEAIGCVLDGMPAGVRVDMDYINAMMDLRKPKGTISTSRVEADEVKIVSGVFEGYTTGTPICILIENHNTRSKDYSSLLNTPRPGHADYTASLRYNGFQDYRGGGHFSGRLTAPIVAAGAIVRKMLEEKDIVIGSHIASVGNVNDDELVADKAMLDKLNERYFAVVNEDKGALMQEVIEEARKACDSVGGCIEPMVLGFPGGIGEPAFDSLESKLSHGLFSIPAVKGVSFGDGFDLTYMKGSEANDAFGYEDGKVVTLTNHNGGINGGISNGMPLKMKVAIKPTPSIAQTQQSVDLKKGENTELNITGRHDPCIVHRARVVIDAMVALVLADCLVGHSGYAYFGEKVKK